MMDIMDEAENILAGESYVEPSPEQIKEWTEDIKNGDVLLIPKSILTKTMVAYKEHESTVSLYMAQLLFEVFMLQELMTDRVLYGKILARIIKQSDSLGGR